MIGQRLGACSRGRRLGQDPSWVGSSPKGMVPAPAPVPVTWTWVATMSLLS